MDDPAARVTLTVERSEGGEGAVTLLWQLDEQAMDDLLPLNGTLVFTQVQDERTCCHFSIACINHHTVFSLKCVQHHEFKVLRLF